MATEIQIQGRRAAGEGMDEDQLIAFLRAQEDESEQYQVELNAQREAGLSAFNREGYPGDEDRDGQSKFVSSDVADAVETLLPDIMDVFFSSDKICEFEGRRMDEEQGAAQATDGVNYVVFSQNNGFTICYTVIKDALSAKTGQAWWYLEESEQVENKLVRNAPAEMMQYISQQEGVEIDEETIEQWQQEVAPGQFVPTYTFMARRKWTDKRVVIEPLAGDELLVTRNWPTPLLAKCPYVNVRREVTLSEIRQMGYDVDVEDLTDTTTAGRLYHKDDDLDTARELDPSQIKTFLNTEFVLVDQDGDGIAERRRIVRLASKILENDEYSHVPVAVTSPYLRPHHWDGSDIYDMVGDLQKLKTATIRDLSDGLGLSSNPRSLVETDDDWNSFTDLDDLMDGRIGGIVRTKKMDGVKPLIMPWAGQHAMPYLEMQEGWKENRVGITRNNQGLDADSLNKTSSGMRMQMNAGQRRTKLMVRVFAETFFVVMCKGILKLLTEGQMPVIAAKIRGDYVELDPSAWRNEYDMTIDVGLGTGNKESQTTFLQGLSSVAIQSQGTPVGQLFPPDRVYAMFAAATENIGYAKPEKFLLDPSSDEAKQLMAQQPPPQPPIELLIEDKKQQGHMQIEQGKAAVEREKLQIQSQADARKSEIDAQQKIVEVDADKQAKIEIARIQAGIQFDFEARKAELAQQMERARIESNERIKFAELEFQREKLSMDRQMKADELASREKQAKFTKSMHNGKANGESKNGRE